MVCSAAVRSAAMSAGRSVRFEPTSATVDADEANPMRRPAASKQPHISAALYRHHPS